ncbi:hypothetical protein Nepgr_009176 [Nepenthes gracilis]|uniref:Peroxidase n=1 Tax=Nepenthes gracilis TaxID=150966 RepID=A0AAD3XK56_NEPGR|nr:hypothetical protein Nepgr_009176 [Nepenthes gracilis]
MTEASFDAPVEIGAEDYFETAEPLVSDVREATHDFEVMVETHESPAILKSSEAEEVAAKPQKHLGANGSSSKGALAIVLILMTLFAQGHGALQQGFYKGKCGRKNVEQVIYNAVRAKFRKDHTLVAAFLRMQFHDCFVRGCEASLLLDGPNSEKTAGANGSVRGFEIIDSVKAVLEKLCPGVVSCADIIVIATRVTVFLAGGRWYQVQTGRRDGLISRASDVNLPGPTIPVSDAVQLFNNKGFTAEEMVLLLGGHTVGVTHCSFVTDRLYDFQNTGRADQSMSPSLLASLRKTCPLNSPTDSPIALDQNPRSVNTVDNSFYKQIVARRGVLQIDQQLALDSQTKAIVQNLANATDFGTRFGRAMAKLSTVGVLTGNQGEIRRSCRSVN